MSTQLTPGITIFNSPEDDTLAEFCNLLSTATTSIHLADYSFNIMEVVDILIAKMKAGLEVKLVLDKSQSAGKTEVPEVKALQAAGVPSVIVESSLHQIMHNKFTLVDGHITLDGSWNFTTAASKENNNYFVFDDNDLAFKVYPVYEKVFEDMWNGKTTVIESKIGASV
jgi:phosphatidylserine/phosphatidylglycerophosphate/cardiolipin synthase-like enzyme